MSIWEEFERKHAASNLLVEPERDSFACRFVRMLARHTWTEASKGSEDFTRDGLPFLQAS